MTGLKVLVVSDIGELIDSLIIQKKLLKREEEK